MAFIGIGGLALLIVGIVQRVRHGKGTAKVSPEAAFWMMLGGGIAFFGALSTDISYSAPVAVWCSMLGWIAVGLALALLIKGQLGPVTGRVKSIAFIGAAIILFPIAVQVQASADKVAMAKAEAERIAAEQRAEAERQAAMEAQYQEALKLMEAQDWYMAADRFSQILNYKDSASLHLDAQYNLAVKYVEDENWRAAHNLLQELPSDYKEVPDLLIRAKDGLTVLLYEEALAEKEKGNWADSERLFKLAKDTGGTMPSDLEDQLAEVTALRIEEEERIAAEQEALRQRELRISREAGEKPENSPWDAAVAPVVSFLKKNLKDPKSVEYIEWSPVTLLELDDGFYWAVRCKYRAKNSFGGYVIEEYVFLIRHGQVVDLFEY